MGCITHIRHILKRDGTNQFERLPDALQPGFVLIDERSREDIIRFLKEFSHQVAYYRLDQTPDGDWETFFKEFNTSSEPHLALVLAFLDLFDHARDRLNELTLRHLEFHYKKVLQVKEKGASPDRVHLLLELAKNFVNHRLEKGTVVKAGKDASGKELYYETAREIVVNKAKVSSIRTVFIDQGLYHQVYCAPVANSADGMGKKLEGDEPKWPAFGERQSGLAPGDRTMADAWIGFAVSSPLLFLAEGDRRMTIAFSFQPLPAGSEKTREEILQEDYSGSFRAMLSGDKGWFEAQGMDVKSNADRTGLTFTVSCDTALPPVSAFDRGIHGASYPQGIPVIKILLDPSAEPYPFKWFRHLRIKRLDIQVSVTGVRDLILQNELGVIDPSKPFMPFGPAPAVGSAFYIGSKEVFSKRLDSLKLRYRWKELPGAFFGFAGHYAGYPGNYDTDGYLAEISHLSGKAWTPASQDQLMKLFTSRTVHFSHRRKPSGVRKKRRAMEGDVDYSIVHRGAGYSEAGYKYVRGAEVELPVLDTDEVVREVNTAALGFRNLAGPDNLTRYDSQTQNGFIRLVLIGQDFGHKAFPAVHTLQAIALSQFNLARGGDPPTLPNPPYTPVLEYLTLDYSAGEQIDLSAGVTALTGYYHQEAFGECPVTGKDIMFLPDYNREGCLYLGISGLEPRQNLSLLFQVAESSNDPDKLVSPGDIRWSYLASGEWKPLGKASILADSTNGLLSSGIIVLDVPADASRDSSRMPSGLHWIKADMAANTAGINKLISIDTQAVEAVFRDTGNDPGHLLQPLASGRISKLAEPRAEVKKITQPFASFGGRPAEGSEPFHAPYYVRVSERLRHKNRAVTVWDVERMVLEAFPGIYKVKCLNHSSLENDICPGQITIVVVDNLRNRNAVNPLQPRASIGTRAAIKEFISKYVSPFVEVNVQNPLYEEILVDFDVVFHPGYDAGFYRTNLNNDIRRFLSPWAYVEGEDILFGNKVYKSSIINFIEERPYVDFVTNFKMFHILDSWGIGCMIVEDDLVVGDREKVLDLDEAEARTSRSIMVSAQEHTIRVTDEAICPEGLTASA